MNLAKKIHCFILCFILIAASCFVSMPVLAEEIAEYGTIANSTNGVRVRSAPGTGNKDVGGLNTGERVKLFELVTISDANYPKWYKIQSVSDPSIQGYVAANFVKEDPPKIEYVPEADFEEYLTKQGFPESYKPMLRSLHANYPNWVFIADHLGMTWDEAVTNESIVGRSLIENSVDDAWKSKEPGAYNWETGKYIGLDGENWVAAHKNVVAYYLDPRNFLNSTDIFQFFMQTYVPELQTLEGLKKIAKNTFLEKAFPETGYATYCDVIMEAAKQSGVSPYVIASMIITEQGTNGQGNSISGTVSGQTGLYNFFNVGASPSSGPYSDSVKNGLYWAKGGSSNSTTYMRPWNTRAKAIIGGAIWYFDEYVNPNTSGGYTIYYKKFDVKKYPYYTFQYMTNIRGAYIEGSKIKKGYTEQELQNSLEFRIPVFKSMPSTITPTPPKTGDNDNYLSSLSVKGHSFTTAFDKWTSEYGVIVDYEVSSVTIEGTKSNSAATVTGLGQVALVVGVNRFNVVVTATSGEKRTYTIVITRKETEAEKPPEPSIETTDYTVGQFITGVDLNTTVDIFKTQMKVKNGTVKVFNTDGSEKTSGIMGTGNVVKIYDSENKEKLSYEIIIYGDVNGNGKIQLSDIVQMRDYYVGNINLTSTAVIKAMDVNRSGNFTLADIVRIRSHYVGDITISQK